ncbi:MAG TPA: Mut7-C RNAse domain-containing protein [Candidatus Kryptonia bacterium]|nr:Mut7-C RNAse domain-containing protein [Candidatus Kryptonia bacterium]
MEGSLKFAADRMLGRLAKWLRLVGVDTLYGSQWSGPALVRVARTERRIVLTRDHRLRRVAESAPVLFIDSDHFREQLQQVLAAYAIDPFAQLLTRCARCNAPLQPLARTAAASRVPEYVFATQRDFVACPRCHRTYWPATHAERVRAELLRIGYAPARAPS